MKKACLASLAALSLLFATSCCNDVAQKPQVKNVIYLIGDGMGFGAVSSLLLTEDSVTGFELAPVIGLSESCSPASCAKPKPWASVAASWSTPC